MKKLKVLIYLVIILLAWFVGGLFDPKPANIFIIPFEYDFNKGDVLGVTISGVDTGLTAERETVTVYVNYGEVTNGE